MNHKDTMEPLFSGFNSVSHVYTYVHTYIWNFEIYALSMLRHAWAAHLWRCCLTCVCVYMYTYTYSCWISEFEFLGIEVARTIK